MNIRERHNSSTTKMFLIAFLCHLPVFLWQTISNSQPIWFTLVAFTAVVLPVALMQVFQPTHAILPAMVGFATMCMSALLIHLQGGMIEMHFHIFVGLAALTAYGLLSPVLTATVTVAIHHIAFFFFLPKSVFNYDATFGIVALHAAFVIIETIPALIIAKRFGYFISLQDSTFRVLANTGTKLQESVSLVKNSSQELSSSSTQAAASMQETAASVQEISSVVQTSKANAEIAMKLSGESREIAESGNKSISALISSMKVVTDSSKKIEEIVSLIDDIAFQTNLLSLNAAVEAARAGEQGKGFAVVADAVRTLAQRSATSAKEISNLISASVQQVQNSNDQALQSGEILQKIVESVQKVAHLNQEIYQATNEQSNGLSQITSAMHQLDNLAQINAKSTLELNQATSDFESQAEQMNELVQSFTKAA